MLRRPLAFSALLVVGACAAKPSPQASPAETPPTPMPVSASEDGEPKPRSTSPAAVEIEELERLLLSPELDRDEDDEGRRRVELCRRLGQLRDPDAVPVLLRALGQPADVQPVAVHRAAASALGHLRDPRAVDALLSVPFRVPDAPTTTSIGERAKLALARIGAPAVPSTLKMLRGEHAEVTEYAEHNGVPQSVVTQTAALALGAIGSASAVPELIEAMPSAGCRGEPPAPADEQTRIEQSAARAVIAHSLGMIGDERAVEPLCGCAVTLDDPGEVFPIIESLGRIGGSAAGACLNAVVRRGKYSRDAVTAEFVLSPRWEAARFAILATVPHELDAVEKAMASNRSAKVKAELKAWSDGTALVAACKQDRACYLRTLTDPGAAWFARETAAFAVARMSPGDPGMAEAIAGASSVRDPDARVSMAWLPAWMLAGKKCQGCAAALQATLDADRAALPVQFQLSVLVARNSIARLEEPG